jgi:hypothetical protein
VIYRITKPYTSNLLCSHTFAFSLWLKKYLNTVCQRMAAGRRIVNDTDSVSSSSTESSRNIRRPPSSTAVSGLPPLGRYVIVVCCLPNV